MAIRGGAEAGSIPVNGRLLLLDGNDVRRLLPMRECVDLMAGALAAFSRGAAVQPLRTVIDAGGERGLLFTMPAWLAEPPALAVKLITLFPGNREHGRESHQGAIVLFDAERGHVAALIDAAAVTAIRTAAVSAVATRLLANPGASRLAILGTGVQALSHLEAMLSVRPVSEVRIWGKTLADAEAFAAGASERFRVAVEPCRAAESAVRDAELVCTVTASREPVLYGAWLAPGVHINAVGAHSRSTRELDTAAIAAASVWVDSREAAAAEAGDIGIPIAEGAIGPGHVRGEIGEALTGAVAGRGSGDEITLFKSLGLAVEDAAAAAYLHRRAIEAGAGASVQFGG